MAYVLQGLGKVSPNASSRDRALALVEKHKGKQAILQKLCEKIRVEIVSCQNTIEKLQRAQSGPQRAQSGPQRAQIAQAVQQHVQPAQQHAQLGPQRAQLGTVRQEVQRAKKYAVALHRARAKLVRLKADYAACAAALKACVMAYENAVAYAIASGAGQQAVKAAAAQGTTYGTQQVESQSNKGGSTDLFSTMTQSSSGGGTVTQPSSSETVIETNTPGVTPDGNIVVGPDAHVITIPDGRPDPEGPPSSELPDPEGPPSIELPETSMPAPASSSPLKWALLFTAGYVGYKVLSSGKKKGS